VLGVEKSILGIRALSYHQVALFFHSCISQFTTSSSLQAEPLVYSVIQCDLRQNLTEEKEYETKCYYRNT